MNCPICGRYSIEACPCKACLPFNLYARKEASDALGWERLRQLLIDYKEELAALRFMRLQKELPSTKFKVLEVEHELAPKGRKIVFVPFIDDFGEKAVVMGFSFGGVAESRDGWHRFKGKF